MIVMIKALIISLHLVVIGLWQTVLWHDGSNDLFLRRPLWRDIFWRLVRPIRTKNVDHGDHVCTDANWHRHRIRSKLHFLCGTSVSGRIPSRGMTREGGILLHTETLALIDRLVG